MGQERERRQTGLSAVRAALVAALVMVGGLPAQALPIVHMTPGGPWVQDLGGAYGVPAGQPIDWTVTICNDSAAPLSARVLDEVHGGECPGDANLTVSCPPPSVAGGTVTACGDAGFGTVDVTAVPVAVGDCADVVLRTDTDVLSPVGSDLGNVAFYFTAVESGQTSPPVGSGCTLVEVLGPLPTEMELELRAVPDTSPFVGGDASATVVYEVTGRNLAPRAIRGELALALPAELTFVEVVTCPPGATCSEAVPGRPSASGLRVPEGETFAFSVRARGGCAAAQAPTPCAQASFQPVEDPAILFLSDSDPLTAGAQATCFPAAVEQVTLLKDYDWIDTNASGTTDAGDVIRYGILVWNAGTGTARGVSVRDRLPLGLDGAGAVTDARGTYDAGTTTASWDIADLGPGSSVELWLEATMVGGAVAANRARATTDLTSRCSLPEISSDDPVTPLVGDATGVDPMGRPAVSLHKAVDSWEDADGDGLLGPGDPIVFRIDIANDGSAPVTAAELLDVLDACWMAPSDVSVAPPDGGTDVSTMFLVRVTELGGADGLVPGESVTVTFKTSTATPATCCNQARVDWATGFAVSDDPTTPRLAEDGTCPVPAEPAVTLRKRVELLDDLRADGAAQVGERVRFVLSLDNRGSVALDDAVVTDELPPGAELDFASVVVPPGAVAVLALPPAGLRQAGRLEVHGVSVPARAGAEVSFEALLTAPAEGTTCNVASLIAVGFVAPWTSEDDASGGATCFDVSQLPHPELQLELSADGEAQDECARPGETLTLVLSGEIGGTAGASATVLRLDLVGAWDVLDADGGAPDAGGITWDLGDQLLGNLVERTVVLGVPCGATTGASLGATASLSSPDALAPATADGPALTVRVPVLAGTVALDHADLDLDLELDPGEVLTVRVTLDETGGCSASDVTARLVVDPALTVVAVLDGGMEAAGVVTWTGPSAPPLALIAAGGSGTVSVELTLAADAPNCARPVVEAEATWVPASGTPCSESFAWSAGRIDTPPGPCVVTDPADLLREDAVTSLSPVTPALGSLLSLDGVPDTCPDGTRTRIDPARVHVADVASALAAGVFLPDEALPGGAAKLVLYEVSHSCARIRACKVDLDGVPATGHESVRIGIARCVP